jgi:hypothetical protein
MATLKKVKEAVAKSEVPKASIEKQADNTWRLVYYRPSPISPSLIAVTEFYLFHEGAVSRFDKISSLVKREQKALRYLKEIQHRLLSVREYHFIIGMDKTKCRNITKRQAGYLKGIWERQNI